MAGAAVNEQPILLDLQKIDKSFPGVHALKAVDFCLRKGEIHALVGENGAGKSTLMKVLTGIYGADSGTIIFDEKKVKFPGPKQAQEAGISIVHQELNLMNHLTAAQNIFIGRESKGFILNDAVINQKTEALFNQLRVKINPTDRISRLTVGKQQMVEIAKAISFQSTVLILDEPTAALTQSEIRELFKIMNELRDAGVSMIYISHRMDEIIEISDRITVMRDGERVVTLNTKETDLDEIIHAMVGRVIYTESKTKSNVPKDAAVVLEVNHLRSRDVKDVSFRLHQGEILGFAGLMGAGRTEVARLIFGADARDGGEILIHGKRIHIRAPKDAVKAGIGYLSEDRKRYGLAVGLSVSTNIVLSCLDNFTANGVVNDRKIDDVANDYVAQVNIKTPSAGQIVRKLSGGNQQKVVVAKWLLKNSDILIFDEPTRGIDVGAKSEIYKLMNELAAAGKSIIMISSELQEILRMSDRVACMCEGRLTGILNIEDASQEKIMRYATTRSEDGGDDYYETDQ